MNPWKLHSYPTYAWPFQQHVAAMLGVDDLSALHGDGPRWTDRDDQMSTWHRTFYDNIDMLTDLYRSFVYIVIAPLMGESFFYQKVPTFRVHLPGNVAVGNFHTDATYHHPLGETTFWTPMTPARDTSSVWIADDDDVLRAPSVMPGDIVEFSAVTRRHGNQLNTSGHSRVSFDFRCLPVRLLPDVEGPPSEHAKLRFIPGEYYASESVTP